VTTTADKLLQAFQLDRLLDDDGFQFDLRQGVFYNPAGTRCCLLSTDLLRGVYLALVEEAGEAWTVILKNCGRIWGERLAKRLDGELRKLFQTELGDLPVGRFVECLREYFAFHGWGELLIETEHTAERGCVEASLRDSIFLEVVDDSQAMVDWLMCGILASIFSYLSGQSLDALQTACPSQGAPTSQFLISAPERIEVAIERLAQGARHQELAVTI
jgi:predicted hydrocarbon binding protein